MLNIVITMAGLGSRFAKAGYKVPKFMIEAKGKTLFEWSLDSLDSFKGNDVNYYFVMQKEHHAIPFIENILKKKGMEHAHFIELDGLTKGQAETAYLAISKMNQEDEVIIYNIDTYVNPLFIRKEQIKGDGCIPCFNAPGEHWSFAKLDETGKVCEVREKVKISDHATIGLYYFKQVKDFLDIYQDMFIEHHLTEKNEYYVAPMYNKMIEKGQEVYIVDIPYEEVDCLGTPEELETFLNK